MRTSLPQFTEWADKRITLKHNWFDRLADVVRTFRTGGDLPTNLEHWPEKYPNLVKWISDAIQTLSPQQLLDLPDFQVWPEEFRESYKEHLHEEYLSSVPRVNEIVEDCLTELSQLDTELRPMLEPGGPVLHAARRLKIAQSLDRVAKRLRDLPENIQWPEPVNAELPSILVIDDLLGRVTSASNGAANLSEHAAEEICELRRAFCERFRLIDEEFPFESENFTHPIARAEFCSGQRFEPGKGFINDLDTVRRKFSQAQSKSISSRWALVVADVLFNTGPPDEHGRGNGESQFGIDQVVPWVKEHAPELPIVALTTEASHSLIQRVNNLNVDYLHRTESSYVDMLIRLARGKRATVSELRRAMHIPKNFVAEDPRMLEVLTEAWDIAQDSAGKTVLITGEPGTGKERLAQFIHDMSPRASEKIKFVNCAQYSKELADSELFGFYGGAFTGAPGTDTNGIFQEADKGTLVLDEFADLDKDVQVKLLRTLEPKRADARPVEPRGNRRSNSRLQTEVNVRIICCTNQPISQVRKDLRTRVAKIIEIPPLHERPTDIVALARHFLSSDERIDAPGLSLDNDAVHFLMTSKFPGNARTLEQLLEVAASGMGKRNIIRRTHLEKAWTSVFRGLSDRDTRTDLVPPLEPKISTDTSAQSSQTLLTGNLSEAVAAILATAGPDQKWLHLSKAETNALDDHLQGRLIDVISILIEWALFRADKAPAIANYLTGQQTTGRAPQDLVRRILKLDEKILQDIIASPYLPDNPPLTKIIEECKQEWEQRKKGKNKSAQAAAADA